MRNIRVSILNGLIRRLAKPSRCNSIHKRASRLNSSHIRPTSVSAIRLRRMRSLANCVTTSAKLAPKFPYQWAHPTSQNTRDRRNVAEPARYYAMLLGGRTIENPSGLARRRPRRRLCDPGGVRDEALGHDFTGAHNPGLAGWESGDLTAGYVEVSDDDAE